MSNASIRRDELFCQDPHCENCGVELVHPNTCIHSIQHGRPVVQFKNQPDNMATVQHKYRSGDIRRSMPTNHERRWFLWCKKCNWEDSQKPYDEELIFLIKYRSWELLNVENLKALKTYIRMILQQIGPLRLKKLVALKRSVKEKKSSAWNSVEPMARTWKSTRTAQSVHLSARGKRSVLTIKEVGEKTS